MNNCYLFFREKKLSNLTKFQTVDLYTNIKNNVEICHLIDVYIGTDSV